MASHALREPPVASNPSSPGARIAFHLRVGVTGHRTLADTAAVAESVRLRLAELRSLFPVTRSTVVKFTIVTALAEGADRLVPREAIAVLGEPNVEVEAVLPLTPDDYRGDFRGEESRRAFEDWLAAASSTVELAQEAKSEGPERDEAYERAGRYIVDHSDVVLAVWSGDQGGGRGGTGEIVKYARTVDVPLMVVPTGPAAASEADHAGASAADALDGLAMTLRAIDKYNGLTAGEASLKRQRDRTRGQLAEALGSNSCIQSQYEAITAWVVPPLIRADVLALGYQKRFKYLAVAIHLLAAFAATAVAMQIVFFHDQPVWLLLEIGCLVLLLVAVWIGKRGAMRDRWVDCRSLAEAFRRTIFIALTGVRDRREAEAAEGPAAEVESWFQRAFSEVWRRRPGIALQDSDAPELHRFLVAAWVDDQIQYHCGAVARHRQLRNRYTNAIAALALVTITVATLHIVIGPRGAVTNWLEFGAIMLPGFGGALTGLREHGQHRRHEVHSRRAITRLTKLRDKTEPSATLEDVQRFAAAVQRVISDESLDWFDVMEFQELEVVI